MTGPSGERRGASTPATIGGYEVLGRLGKGAMGIVYKARDPHIEREVAVKVLMADLESESEIRARFFREAQVTSKLLHRNIVTIFHMGEEDGRLFIVMELLKGRTLAEFLKEPGRDALEERLDLMIQTCDGLAVAHAKGVVHRDVKPGNLFVQSDGGLKILDFGVARLASSNMTASGFIMGTPDYMSPEQARGQEVDQRADIFSAAAVFYLMLTGRKPFAGADLPNVLHNVIREDPSPIREHEAPAVLARIVLRALNKDAERRYQQASDMAADLVRFRRHFDAETRRMAAAARERFDEVAGVAAGLRAARLALELPASVDLEVQETVLREQFPFFCVLPDGRAPRPVLFRRGQVTAMLQQLQAALDPLGAELSTLESGRTAVGEAELALGAGRAQEAANHFTRAAQAVSADSPRIARGRAAAVVMAADQQARSSRLKALLAEARTAERAGDWTATARCCADALAIDPGCAEAMTLSERADAAAAAEADAQAREQLARQTREAIGSARQLFDSGDRDAAIERLEAFGREHPGADVATESGRLRAAAKRIAEDAERYAQADVHAATAELRWQAADATAALTSADLALALHPDHPVARHIRGLAQARLRAESETAARRADAQSSAARAATWLSKGQFDKAAREAQLALDLDGQHAEAGRILSEARRLAMEAVDARDREAAAHVRNRQIDNMLKAAQSALKNGEPRRAAYTLEDALRLDPGHALATQLLDEARAAIAALAARDVRAPVPSPVATADADDTAVIRRPKVRELAASVGNWAGRLRRRLQSSRGETTTEWMMVAVLFIATVAVALPGALRVFAPEWHDGLQSLVR